MRMRILCEGEDWLFYLQTIRVIETPMKIQEMKVSFSQRIQLLGDVTVDLSTSSGNNLLVVGDEEELAGPSVDVPSKRNKGAKVNAFWEV